MRTLLITMIRRVNFTIDNGLSSGFAVRPFRGCDYNLYEYRVGAGGRWRWMVAAKRKSRSKAKILRKSLPPPTKKNGTKDAAQKIRSPPPADGSFLQNRVVRISLLMRFLYVFEFAFAARNIRFSDEVRAASAPARLIKSRIKRTEERFILGEGTSVQH